MKCKECDKVFESLDSLRRHRSQKHNINAEQTYIDYILNGVAPVCKCGCSERPKYLGIDAGYRDYKRGHAARINNNWGHNKLALEKSHATQKKMHEDGTLSVWNKGLTISDERVKDNIAKVMANPQRGINISKKLTGVQKSEEHKKKLKLTANIRWSDESEREKQSHRRMEYIIKNGFQTKSKLEETFKELLINNFNFIDEVDYYHQYYVREIK